ncbi:MAG: hypothetical protein JO000_11360 [Alphaproteobacteria bacterium]|nr:hypothetical protein [Alphaproteobacteria bacterium]
MIDLDLLPLGWVHLLASLIALVLGGLLLIRRKGTDVHKARGRLYVVAIVLTSLTALAIYRVGGFFFAHWSAIAALIATAIGVTAARFRLPRAGWIHLHLTCMLTSLYVLIGGGVNEVFLRVSWLRQFAPNFNSPAVGITHFAVMLLFAALIAYFNVAVLRRAAAVPTRL